MNQLETKEQQIKFLTACAEFIPYISGDCAGLGPGETFFKESVKGLAFLAGRQKPGSPYLEVMEATIIFYTTLRDKVPGPRGTMYPRGGKLFDDLPKLDRLHEKLLDIISELVDPT